MALFRGLGRRLKRKGSKLSDYLVGINKRTRSWSKQSRDSDLAATAVLAVVATVGQPEQPEEFSYSNQDGRPSVDAEVRPPVVRSIGNRKPSKLEMVFRPTSSRLYKPIDATEEMLTLERVIKSDSGRKSLVQALLSSETDYAVKIRFCSAIDKLVVVEDEEERKSMTEALVELFLTPSSMFFISSVSKARAKAIVNGQFDQLAYAKLEVLAELAASRAVMEIVSRH